MDTPLIGQLIDSFIFGTASFGMVPRDDASNITASVLTFKLIFV